MRKINTVNLNNMMINNIPYNVPNNIVQNNANINNQLNNMDKGAFLKLMNQLINSNNTNNNGNADVVPQLNIMDALKPGINSNTNMPEALNLNMDVSEEINLNNFDWEEKLQTNMPVESFMLMPYYFNQVSDDINLEQLSLQNNSYLNGKNNLPTTYTEGQVFTNDKSQESTIKTELQNMLQDILPKNAKAEKLISEIEGNREKLVKGIEYNIEQLAGKAVQGDNKVITITDESSKLNSQVLTQVKDKIVFMSEDGKDTGAVKQVTMELQPHNLGKVHIKMEFKDKEIVVEIKAMNEETQKILSSSKGELTNILQKSIDSPVNIVVKVFESSNNNPNLYQDINQDNQQGHNENYDQDNGQNKQRNYYTKQQNNDSDEESVFSELINLRNFKLQ